MAIITGTDISEVIDANDGVTDQDDSITGLGGDDDIFGLGGSDNIDGGSGDDNLRGGEGGDTIEGGFGFDILRGENGDDTLEGGIGGDELIGGDGADTATYKESGAGVTVNLAEGTASGGEAAGDTLIGIENLKGSGRADTLTGNELDNVLEGGGGADNLRGGLGDDTYAVLGGESVITEDANAGDDRVFAAFEESGSITLPQNFETLIVIGLGDDVQITATGTEASDVIGGISGQFRLNGRGGNDELTGGDGKDALFGSADNDVLSGNENNDTLDGGSHNDTLRGDAGKDVLIGDTGKDKLFGGVDADRFDFDSFKESAAGSNRDVIYDFSRGGGDVIDLRTIDAKTTTGGNNGFKFIGNDAFSKTAGELHYLKKSGYVYAEGDVNGDAKADFQIKVEGVRGLDAGDFLL